LVREWCGTDAAERSDELVELHAEVVRLRSQLVDLVRWLKDNGHPVKAALVLKPITERV